MAKNKLQIAVKAKVPVLTCTTRDIPNLASVLHHLLPTSKIRAFQGVGTTMAPGTVDYAVGIGLSNDLAATDVRKHYVSNKSTLLIVNPLESHSNDISMAVGALDIPSQLLYDMLNPIIKDDEITKNAMAALGGATLREAYEISIFCMAETKSLTPAGLAVARNELFKPQKGLYPVQTSQSFYDPSEAISEWVKSERHFFLNETDASLIPRGLMLDGRPGTGKSEAAKYIARKFEVPLYRLDISTTQDKWVGNSAKYLQANLDMLDQQEPCVVLIDEVEKVISKEGGSHTTDLLSMLLWWMQTHTSKVLTICTTNDLSKIPPEFYRPGRLDEVITIQGLTTQALPLFVKAMLKRYEQVNNDIMHAKIVADLIEVSKGNLTTPAAVEAMVKKIVKKLKMAEAAPKTKLIFKKKTL